MISNHNYIEDEGRLPYAINPRTRPAGAGFKPPGAAFVKSIRRERLWKRQAFDLSGKDKEDERK